MSPERAYAIDIIAVQHGASGYWRHIMYVIQIYHADTHEKLHEYGPFEHMGEVTDFARAHNIDLILTKE